MAPDQSKLSEQQKEVFEKITNEKKNIFFTGCAGTGKSFLLKQIIQHYRTVFGNPQSLAVTASTGRAGTNIGGSTLHSFAGLGLGKGEPSKLIQEAVFNKVKSNRWRNVKVLIIDEISMLNANYFDLVEETARAVRRNEKPFGGIQLILTGDLLQLPPVSEGLEKRKHIFQSSAWSKCQINCSLLTEVFRQTNYEFIKFLTCIRVGAVTQEVLDFSTKLTEPKHYDSESGPVNLYSTKKRTDTHNAKQLESIDSELYEYVAVDYYRQKSKHSSTDPLDNCPVPPTLQLKKGAQVMLVRNINKHLVNGTVGIVTGFSKYTTIEKYKDAEIPVECLPIVRFHLANGRLLTRVLNREVWSQQLSTGEEIASRKQIPLILAWAVTIHKSQGQTIQRLKVDLSDIFESGQIYTALSRAIGPETLEISGFDPTRVSVDQDSLEFCITNNLI